jgi:Lrp/AsnC family leucine-responsive transcriptional regulator
MARIIAEADKAKVDVKDRKILVLLAENSRRPVSEIAKKVRLSRDSVSYRINRMHEQGIIRMFSANASLMKLGYLTFHVLLALDQTDKEKSKALIGELVDHPSTISLMEYSYRWDLEWRVVAKDLNEFEAVVSAILSKHSRIILEREKFVVLDKFYSVLFPYHFYKKTRIAPPKKKTDHHPDQKDIQILHHLSIDSRQSTYELSKKIKLSPDAIGLRIKKLVASGIIKNFSLVPCFSHLGYSWYTVMIKMKMFDKKNEAKFRTFVENHPHIVRANKAFGSWDVLVYVIADSTRSFHDTIKQIKTEFAANIGAYSSFIAYKEHVFNPLPKVIEAFPPNH